MRRRILRDVGAEPKPVVQRCQANVLLLTPTH